MKKFDLEERLIDFAVIIIRIADTIVKTRSGNYLSGQLQRSGTSPALNYGEAQAGESRKDFIHKMKIALKELRETYNNLRIIKKAKLHEDFALIEEAIHENNELISIFVSSVLTAEKNGRNI